MFFLNVFFLSVFFFIEIKPSHSIDGSYIQIKDSEQRDYKPFPLSRFPTQQLCNPVIDRTYIRIIPNGHAYSAYGVVFTENGDILSDVIWPNDDEKKYELTQLTVEKLQSPEHIAGRVAVITQGGQSCYYHWLTEVLGRLAMLDKAGIAYDKVYAPVDTPFKKETLKLWGVADDQIIEPYGCEKHIEADELIVPSLVDRLVPDLVPSLSSYASLEIVQALRAKFLPIIERDVSLQNKYSKKIFISRKDAVVRKVINEDEVFERFEKLGFVRYELSKLSFKEQVALFRDAEKIVAVHGAGLANIIFSQPGTELIEIFQARSDTTYWYLSQQLGLKHTCFATQEFEEMDPAGFKDTEIAPHLVDAMIEQLVK